ncbi:MAG: VWA domain-containing protein [Chloroflexi bacterium]|nr:VWA domain-containing protein [Chloroflexota bacterium]
MFFLAPFALALSLLAVPIILLYMLRLRRREVQVSSTLLWRQLLQDREANAPWQRLRRNLLLFLQLLTLAALVLALARPYTEVPTLIRGRVALLLDASASMNATDVQPSRFEAARRFALELIETLSADDEVVIIRVAERAEVLVNYTSDSAQLRAALERAQPGRGVADWDAALTLAAAGAQGAEKFTILLLSDGGLPQHLNLELYGEVRHVPFGVDGQNVAISALATARNPVRGAQIYARLTNHGDQPAEVIFSLSLDGALHSAAPYRVAENGAADIIIDNLPAEFRRVQAQLTRSASSALPDHLSIDDTAYAVYTPIRAERALLMSKGNLFLERGLAALNAWQVYRGDPERGLPTERFDLYIFDGWLPPTLPNANILIVNPPPEPPPDDLYAIGELSTQTKVLRVRPDDPRTRYLNFNDVNVRAFRKIRAEWADALVEAVGGALILAGEFAGRRIAILPFNLLDSDLPLKIAYPILLANLTAWYQAPRALSLEGSARIGQAVAIQPPPEADLVRVAAPDGATTTFRVGRPPLIYAETKQTGIYSVDMYKGAELIQQEFFAVNLFSEGESDIAPRAVQLGSSAEATTAQRPQEVGQREFWSLFALIGLAILAFEWFIYHRRLGVPRLRGAALSRFSRVGRRAQRMP